MQLNFEASPVAFDFLRDRAPFQCIVGPVGSGKSVASMIRPLAIGQEQEPSPANARGRRIRKTRGVIVRNTMPELRATTMDTYGRIYPPEHLGPIIHRAPAEHTIKRGDVECEILFIGLDKPSDVKKLLSLEVTWFFVNEGREVPRAVINRLNERIGRYAIEERDTTWSGVWMDTNAPDADHWLYRLDQVERPAGWQFYHQAPAVLEVQETSAGLTVTDENFPGLQGQVWTTGTVAGQEFPCEAIRASDRVWMVNPQAENLGSLWRVNKKASPLGPASYYGRALQGKSVEEIRSYLQGVYTFVAEGRRVIPNYHQTLHSKERINAIEDAEIIVAADVGGGTLQPSAVFLQRHPRGPILALGEVVCVDATGLGQMGMHRFGETVMEYAARWFPQHLATGKIKRLIGDPAGVGRDEIFEVACFDYLSREFGFHCEPAPTQDPKLRIQAVVGPCGRLVDGVPALLVDRSRCPMLHKGLSGAWHYKRVKVAGEDRYQDKPLKNDVSHPCDALCYGVLGMGEIPSLPASDRFNWSGGTVVAGEVAL